MGIRQGFRNWITRQLGRAGAQMSVSRTYAGAVGGRLTADWVTAGTSADAEILGSLNRLRNRARQQVRDTPYTAQLKRLYRDNIVGPAGIQLQMTVARLRGDGLDEPVGNSIETAWKRWCNKDSCDVRGKWSFRGFEWYAASAPVDQGEYLYRFVYQAFGKNNKIPLALEPIEPDQLDENYAGTPSTEGGFWRLGIEFNKWGRPINYAIWTTHPGDYLPNGTSYKKRRHEIIPADDIIHGFFGDRIQSRGVPLVACVMSELNQMEGYETAVTVRARAAAALMGFIQTPDGQLRGDSVEDGQRLSEFQPGVIKYLGSGESIVVPDIKAPDNQYEMFVKQKGKRFAAGSGVNYASVTRDATESSYSQQRQEYLQDQDAWSVLQAIQMETLNQRVFEKWLPLAVLAGAVRLPDFYDRPERYFDAASWQTRGWAWIDPKKEAEALQLLEEMGIVSKMEICAMRGTSYDQVLKNKERERKLEERYGYTPPPRRPRPADTPPQEDLGQ